MNQVVFIFQKFVFRLFFALSLGFPFSASALDFNPDTCFSVYACDQGAVDERIVPARLPNGERNSCYEVQLLVCATEMQQYQLANCEMELTVTNKLVENHEAEVKRLRRKLRNSRRKLRSQRKGGSS